MYNYQDSDGNALTIGSRVELTPGLDLWMRGARYGVIIGMRPTPNDALILRMDKLPGRKFSCAANQVTLVG